VFERLVLAIDGSPSGEVGVSFATALARTHRSVVHVVHADVLLVAGRGASAPRGGDASWVVTEAVAQLLESGVEATGERITVAYHHLGAGVARVAERFRADAIVVGSHRHRGLDRVLSQGARGRITRSTSLPVLAAPAPLQLARVHRPGLRTGSRPLSAAGPLPPEA
jgi:nucleotide-binding universal stress UspA family protein